MIELKHNSATPALARDQTTSLAVVTNPPRPPGHLPTPDAMKLLKALRRRWCSALFLGVTMALLGGAAAYFVVPKAKYSARAMLHVSNSPKYIIFDPKERFADYRTYQRTQVAMVKSLFVLSDAIRKPGVAALETIRQRPDPVEWLSLQLKADFPDASEVFEISMSGDNPNDLVVLINSVVDSYLKLVVNEEQEERRIRLETLKKLWKTYQDTLQAKRAELRQLSESIGSNDKVTLQVAQQSKIRQRDIAMQEHMRIRFELIKAESDLAVLTERVDNLARSSPPPALVNERVEALPAIQRLVAEVRRYNDRYTNLRFKLRDGNDPALREILAALESSRRNLNETRQKYRDAIALELRNEASREDREALIKLQAQVSMAKTYRAAIEEDLERLGEETKTINRGSLDLTHKQDELEIVNVTAQKIRSEVEAMEVELGAPPRIRIVDRATLPGQKDELRKVKAGGVAAAGSMMIVVFLVSFWEFRARRIVETEEVVNDLGMRVVGALPALPNVLGPARSQKDKQMRSLLVESVDAIRAVLLHLARVEGIRTVLITSAVQGEGKTSLACQLATSLARTGRRTILVDCDLRCASVHKIFDSPPGPGLSELLRGEAKPVEVVYETLVPGLQLLPAGHSDAHAVEALSREQGHQILEELKTRYDFVILDSAPVLAVADTLLVGQLVDAVIFSILHNVSRVPLVSAACARLDDLGVRILGAVVNGTPTKARRSDYHYPLMPEA